jgi:hypothetical protein
MDFNNDTFRRFLRLAIFIIISWLISKYYIGINDSDSFSIATLNASLYMTIDTFYPRIHYDSKN